MVRTNSPSSKSRIRPMSAKGGATNSKTVASEVRDAFNAAGKPRLPPGIGRKVSRVFYLLFPSPEQQTALGFYAHSLRSFGINTPSPRPSMNALRHSSRALLKKLNSASPFVLPSTPAVGPKR